MTSTRDLLDAALAEWRIAMQRADITHGGAYEAFKRAVPLIADVIEAVRNMRDAFEADDDWRAEQATHNAVIAALAALEAN